MGNRNSVNVERHEQVKSASKEPETKASKVSKNVSAPSYVVILPVDSSDASVNPFSWWSKFNADARVTKELGYGAMGHRLIASVIGLPKSKILPQGGIGVCVLGGDEEARVVEKDFLRVVGNDYPICIVANMGSFPFD